MTGAYDPNGQLREYRRELERRWRWGTAKLCIKVMVCALLTYMGGVWLASIISQW